MERRKAKRARERRWWPVGGGRVASGEWMERSLHKQSDVTRRGVSGRHFQCRKAGAKVDAEGKEEAEAEQQQRQKKRTRGKTAATAQALEWWENLSGGHCLTPGRDSFHLRPQLLTSLI